MDRGASHPSSGCPATLDNPARPGVPHLCCQLHNLKHKKHYCACGKAEWD